VEMVGLSTPYPQKVAYPRTLFLLGTARSFISTHRYIRQ